ncbi:hypothetical protein HYPSUDRAFT_920514 [Hypholoma sublateritium FD-334 SS-4]|uniref:Uncharacterized protein n=1 Tax=Hypholoma sublateritium (strain FD-334 SS-4) TaxID=945553 RepID=A0A0D2KVR2_HYPSF|nr:hypothetical protein HYPSUDRAFT_920514 [Hypholoma sublateritium FD-334 SS-4]
MTELNTWTTTGHLKYQPTFSRLLTCVHQSILPATPLRTSLRLLGVIYSSVAIGSTLLLLISRIVVI